MLQYKKQILTPQNKARTTWNIFSSEAGKKIGKEDITSQNNNGMLIRNQQTIAKILINIFQH